MDDLNVGPRFISQVGFGVSKGVGKGIKELSALSNRTKGLEESGELSKVDRDMLTSLPAGKGALNALRDPNGKLSIENDTVRSGPKDHLWAGDVVVAKSLQRFFLMDEKKQLAFLQGEFPRDVYLQKMDSKEYVHSEGYKNMQKELCRYHKEERKAARQDLEDAEGASKTLSAFGALGKACLHTAVSGTLVYSAKAKTTVKDVFSEAKKAISMHTSSKEQQSAQTISDTLDTHDKILENALNEGTKETFETLAGFYKDRQKELNANKTIEPGERKELQDRIDEKLGVIEKAIEDLKKPL